MILDAARGRAADFRAVFRIAPFRIYQTGAILMTLGFWMQRVGVGWLIWRMTGSEAWLGLVAFAELFPAILTGLAGGGIADRSSAPVVLFWGNLALVGVSAALLALSLAGGLTPGMVLVLMVLVGGISGLILPARLSMATFLVPVTLLPTALAVNSTGFNLSRFIGPALAAGILAFGPADWVFGFSMLGYGALSLALFRIRNATPQAGRPARAAGDNGSAWAVIRKLPATPVIFGVIVLQFATGVLIRPAMELFPAFAETVFDRGAAGLGFLNAALGFGAVLGALAFSRTRDVSAALRQIIGSAVIFAVALLGFVATTHFALALMILVVHGAAMTSSNIAALGFVQINTPLDRLGRVLSLYAVVFRAGPALGAFLFGMAAEHMGLGPTGLVFGLVGLAAILGLGAFVIGRHRAGTAGGWQG